MSDLETLAYSLGISEAHKKGGIVTAAYSKLMMEFIKEHSQRVGDSIPWIKAFNRGVAEEVGRQTVSELRVS